MKIDLILNYYDTPLVLKHWLYRLIHHSDFINFSKFVRLIIADSGTPIEKLPASLEVAKTELENAKFSWSYIRSDTDNLRALVRKDLLVRMNCHSFNNAALDYSNAELIITSQLGIIFYPDYFACHIKEHLRNPKAVVLPRRFDLISDTYHTQGYKTDSLETILSNIRPSGGWADMSIRRHWLVEVNGWDEWYQFIAPIDMDLGSRLTGKLDNGMPSEALYPQMGQYKNLGLDFVQPSTSFVSLICNMYDGHIPTSQRKITYDYGIDYYLKTWSKIVRDRIPSKFEVIYSK